MISAAQITIGQHSLVVTLRGYSPLIIANLLEDED